MALMDEAGTSESKGKRGPKSKLEQQIEHVHQLPRTKQKFISEMLETMIQQQ
jgi:peptide deformylase